MDGITRQHWLRSTNLGILYKIQGKMQEAEEMVLRALQERERAWVRGRSGRVVDVVTMYRAYSR